MGSMSARHWLYAAVAACTVVVSTGCAPLVIGSAVVAGSMAVDRRTAGAQIDDKSIQLKAGSAYSGQITKGAHINTTAFNRNVLLTGEVPTEQDRVKAETLAQNVENVRHVYNELSVQPATSLSQRSSDTIITGRVQSRIIAADNLPSKSITVTTERGTVYLMGLVTEQEAERTAELARSTIGVGKVVRVFEYISEEELSSSLADRQARIPTEPVNQNGGRN